MITPGELAVGQFVTVHHWLNDNSPENKKNKEETEEDSGDVWQDSDLPFFGGVTTKKTFINNSFKGDVLEIMAIQLPYLVVKNRSDTIIYERPIHLDLRNVALMECDEAYIKAFNINK